MIGIKPSIENDNDNDNNNDIEEPITLVVDASGLTVSKTGDYIEEKWLAKLITNVFRAANFLYICPDLVSIH